MARLGDSFWSRSGQEDDVVWPSSWTSGGSAAEEAAAEPDYSPPESNGAAVEPELEAEPDPIAAGLIELQESISRLEALNSGAWNAEADADVDAGVDDVAQLAEVHPLEEFRPLAGLDPLEQTEEPVEQEAPAEPAFDPFAEAPTDIRETLRRLVDATDRLDLEAFAVRPAEAEEDVVVETTTLAEAYPASERLPQPADQSQSLIVRYDAGVELHFTGPSARFLERLLRASAELDSLARALPAELDEPAAADD